MKRRNFLKTVSIGAVSVPLGAYAVPTEARDKDPEIGGGTRVELGTEVDSGWSLLFSYPKEHGKPIWVKCIYPNRPQIGDFVSCLGVIYTIVEVPTVFNDYVRVFLDRPLEYSLPACCYIEKVGQYSFENYSWSDVTLESRC